MTVYFDKMSGAMRKQRDWLLAMVSCIGDAVIATDNAEIITFLNPEAAHLVLSQ